MSPEHRRLVWLLLGGLALLLFYLVIVNPLLNLSDSWTQELTRRRQILTKYQALIGNKTRIVRANQAMKAALANAGNQFLSGGNAAVAASDLQEIVKKLARDHGVQLASAKILPSREAGPYLEVPVQVQFTGTMDQVLIILYHLEHHKKLLFIPELDINAPRWQKGEKNDVILQVNMVISGVIKKGVAS
ncbi:MAG: type II secretion system protein GspM [Syntrophobacterales bacterium]|nr:type II secretion system protein GspM [Syntrophobacterales bacterium]